MSPSALHLAIPLLLTTTMVACKDNLEVVDAAQPVLLGLPYDVQQDSLTLSWTESTIGSFDRYELYRGDASGVSTEDTLVLTSEHADETIFTDQGLGAYQTYFYRIWVFNSAGDSAASNEVSGSTEYETGPTAIVLEDPSDVTATSMVLSWSQSQAADFHAYRLYRDEQLEVDEGATLVHSIGDVGLTDFLDTGLIPNTTYYYRVYVEDEWGFATGSNVVTATTLNTEAPWCSIARAPAARPIGERFGLEAVDCGDNITPVDGLLVRWDFGEGDGWTSATTDKATTHAYAHRGAYEVTLEVSDGTYTYTTATTLVVTDPHLMPAGDYLMGRETGSTPWPDQEPQRTVSLSPFLIDRFETTTASYAAFLTDGGAAEGHYHSGMEIQAEMDGSYAPQHGWDDKPMVGATWYDAAAYCAWAGGSLPTEAQWEAAARGPADGPGYQYPWGDDLPYTMDPVPANFDSLVGEVVEVESYEDGVTAWDASVQLWQLAGNADEWVSDYYDPDYYEWAVDNGDSIDPQGPASSPYTEADYRVSRGGSWVNDENPLRVSFRCYADPWQRGATGFRCAWPPDAKILTAAGGEHSCSLDSAGFVVCWGDDSYGQAPTPAGGYLDVATGQAHTCAVSTDGALACWGDDSSGQASPPSGSFTAVRTGWDHSCAIDTAGAVQCWGADDYGQSSPPTGSFVALGVGDYHGCAIDTHAALHCWGMNDHGEATPPEGSFTAVDSGHFHSCAIDSEGAAHCWGSDDDGESSPPEDSWVDISAGQGHSCGITSAGTARCWGSDYYDQASPPDTAFTQVSAGALHSCGIDGDGLVQCWGRNNAGQCSAP